MPADGLTKGSCAARSVLADFLTRGYWRLVQDATFTSAKKRRQQGREAILDDGVEREPFFPAPDCDEDEDDYQARAARHDAHSAEEWAVQEVTEGFLGLQL